MITPKSITEPQSSLSVANSELRQSMAVLKKGKESRSN